MRETKRKPLEMVRTFTTDLVMKAIKSCRNSKAFGPDKLSIFHLKHLGPRAIEYIRTLFNLSATTCRILAIWKSSLCCCLPTPMTLANGGSPMFPLAVHQPASPSIWPAVQSLRRGVSTNPGTTMWCVCGCS